MPKYSNPRADKLRRILSEATDEKRCILMPCCGDALSAKLIAKAGFQISFMSGYYASGTLGHPDTGILGRGDMVSRAREIISVVPPDFPIIGDGDTGYGNAVNVKQTVQDYALVGLAGIMIEDQVSPKKCGHTKGKQVVDREEAYKRIKAAVDARNEGMDIFILARTDAAGPLGMEEALERCRMFKELGVDMTFLEAPDSIAGMERYCKEVSGWKLANMIEKGGKTPVLTPQELGKMGYTVSAHPVTLLSAAIKAMNDCLTIMKQVESGEATNFDAMDILSFQDLCKEVGFGKYWEEEQRYK